jgi:hypothetical protein
MGLEGVSANVVVKRERRIKMAEIIDFIRQSLSRLGGRLGRGHFFGDS